MGANKNVLPKIAWERKHGKDRLKDLVSVALVTIHFRMANGRGSGSGSRIGEGEKLGVGGEGKGLWIAGGEEVGKGEGVGEED